VQLLQAAASVSTPSIICLLCLSHEERTEIQKGDDHQLAWQPMCAISGNQEQQGKCIERLQDSFEKRGTWGRDTSTGVSKG